MTVPFARSEAVEYTRQHWFKPCDDGVIFSRKRGAFRVEDARQQHRGALQPGPKAWQAVFLPEVDAQNRPLRDKERACFIRPDPNGTPIAAPNLPPDLAGRWKIVVFHTDDGLVDCAHYVSRCLTKAGLKIDQPGVPGLVSELRRRPMTETKTLGHKVTKQQGDRILGAGLMKPGDVITYFHQTSGDYTHSVIYLGFDAGRSHHDISCHTIPRFRQFYNNDNWSIVGESPDTPNWRFTLIHVVGPDDRQPTALTLLALAGWWKVEVGSRTEYYLFSRDGTVDFTSRPPLNGAQRTIQSGGKGYWFETVPEVLLTWPNRGQVERWSVFGVENLPALTITVDGVSARATRIL